MNKIKCLRIQADEKQIARGKQHIRLLETPILASSNVFNLLGNTVRLQVLHLLHVEKRLCVCDMSDILSMNVSAISQHLRKLKDGGIVITERAGQTIYYSISPNRRTFMDGIFDLTFQTEDA